MVPRLPCTPNPTIPLPPRYNCTCVAQAFPTCENRIVKPLYLPCYYPENNYIYAIVSTAVAGIALVLRRYNVPDVSALSLGAAGILAWFPVNAIADEMPVLVAIGGKTVPAVFTITMQIGNIALFWAKKTPTKELTAMLPAMYVIGLVSLTVVASTINTSSNLHALFAVCGLLVGLSGTIASSTLWMVSQSFTKELSTGMALSSAISGLLILVQNAGPKPSFDASEYFSLCIIIMAIVSTYAAYPPEPSNPTETEKLIDEAPLSLNEIGDEGCKGLKQNSTARDVSLRDGVVIGFLYAANYGIPSLFPYALQSELYRYTLISANIADVAGRWLYPNTVCRQSVVVSWWLGAISITLLGVWVKTEPLIMCVFVVATLLRGGLITSMQNTVTGHAAQRLAIWSQLGALVGATVGLLVFTL